jgi:hypothetical protein
MATLIPHTARADADEIWTIEACVAVERDSRITLAFTVRGEVERIAIPPIRSPRFVEGLWQHTCFELFLARDGDDGYFEINLSPSREWAVFSFQGYRSGAASHTAGPPIEIFLERAGETLRLEASLQLPEALREARTFNAGLCAVVEDSEGSHSYWALRHDNEKPDFHDRRGFTMRVEARPGA